MTRFDYVKYDKDATDKQMLLKENFLALEAVLAFLPESRNKSLCLTKLEEAYMWAGKAIRDEQIKRTEATELQEERTNS